MDTKVKKLITRQRTHHPRANEERLNIKKESGGRGLIQQKLTTKSTTTGLNEILRHYKRLNTSVIKNAYEKQKKKYSISKEKKRFTNQLVFTPKEII